MSIASEITNYANGLSDAYDAVNDMSGVIPQDKNMNNLDTAIRTIPVGTTPNDGVLTITQNGVTIQTFSANQSTNATAALTDTTYSAFTGATSSVAGASGLVPAPTTSDPGKYLKGDGTWDVPAASLVEMSYGESNAWAKFIAAYNAGSIVYCRASSNANPGTGSQTRKAFMAYVNNATSPTSVEFQYVRSVSSKTSSQPVDQVFVYTLTNASGGTWSVATRDMAPKLAAGANASVSYSNGTYTVSATDTTYSNMTGATSGTAGAAGLVPAPAAGDESKFLQGDGTWATVSGGGTTLSMQDWDDLFVSSSVIPTTDFTLSIVNGTGSINPGQAEDYELAGATTYSPYTLLVNRTPANADDPMTVSVAMYSGGSTVGYFDNLLVVGNTISFETGQAVGWYPIEYEILTITCGSVTKTLKIAQQ